MNKLAVFKFVPFFVLGFIAIANLGCDSKSDDETKHKNSAKIANELTSLGARTTGALYFELKCKTEGSKLYWILETRQTVLGIMGIGGFSGQDASEMAGKITKEFRTSADNSTPQNKIKIEFLDGNGFTITKTTTNEISDLDADGKAADPLDQGWYYRGVIDLSPADIAKVTNFQLRGDFSENMDALLKEAGVLVEKKKKEIGN